MQFTCSLYVTTTISVIFLHYSPGLITRINFTIDKALVGRPEVKNPVPARIILKKIFVKVYFKII